MAVTKLQANALIHAYSYVRRMGFLESSLGSKLFTSFYFFYKRHLEDPFWALAKRRPDLFRGGHVLDIGANIGYTAAVFARVTDPEYHVYAFEPEPFNFRLLQGALAARHLSGRVIPIHSAAGETQGTIDLWLNLQHHADHRVATPEWRSKKQDESVTSVPLTSIDFFVRQHGISGSVAFIKIDVQGYEFPVCRGMEETLRTNPRAVVALEYMPKAMRELGFDAPALLRWFTERNYRLYSLTSAGDLIPGISHDLSSDGYTDLVFSTRDLQTNGRQL